jgi:hypothetical protein
VRGAADVGESVVSVMLAGVIRALRSHSKAIVTPIAAITVAQQHNRHQKPAATEPVAAGRLVPVRGLDAIVVGWRVR